MYKDDFSSVVYKDEGVSYVDLVFSDHTQYYDAGTKKADVYNRYDYSVMVSPGTRVLWVNIGYPYVNLTPGSSRGVASGSVRLSTPYGYCWGKRGNRYNFLRRHIMKKSAIYIITTIIIAGLLITFFAAKGFGSGFQFFGKELGETISKSSIR